MRLGPILCTVASVVAAGCADLPPLGECGNTLIEDGEACDGPAADGTCGGPGTAAACRFVCGDGASCPAGHGCGDDGVCRAPSGRFEARGLVPLDALHVRLADLDGDGATDAIGQRGGISIRYGVPGGGFADDGPLLGFSFIAPFELGDLDGDARDDIVGATDIGVVGFLGDDTRDLPALPMSATDSSVLEIDVAALRVAAIRSDDFLPLSSVITVTDDFGMCIAQYCTFPTARTALPPGAAVGELQGIAVGNVAGLAADEIGLAFTGDDRVHVYRVAQVTIGPDTVLRLELRETVVVPGTITSEARFVDLAGDGGLDLAVAVMTATGERVVVATGGGLGFGAAAFDPTFDALVSNTCSSRPWPLAIARINADPTPDYVGDLAICHGSLLGPIPAAYAPLGSPWDRAEVADFDEDGRLDVLGATAGGRLDVALQTATGTFPFSLRSVDLGGALRRLRIGDFDGNGAADVAVAVRTPRDDRVAVVFGAPGGVPAPPVVMARYEVVEDLVALDLLFAVQSTLDAATDLFVVARAMPGAANVYGSALAGHGSQQMSSPFPLPAMGDETAVFAFGVVPGNYAAAPGTPLDVFVTGGATTGLGGSGTVDVRRGYLLANAGGQLTSAGLSTLTPAWASFPAECAQGVRLRGPDRDTVAIVTGAGDPNHVFCAATPGGPAAPQLGGVDPGMAATTPPVALPGAPAGRQVVAAGDLDGDERDDVVIGFADGGGALVVVPNPATGPDVAGATSIAVRAHAVAVLSDPGGAYVVVRTDDALELRRAGSLETVAIALPLDPAGAGGLVTGDIDRDGVTDLALVEGGLLRWFLQLPDDYAR